MLRWIDTFNSLLELIVLINFLTAVLTPRFKKVYNILIWILISFVPILLTMPWREEGNNIPRSFIIISVLLLNVFISYKDKWTRKIFVYLQHVITMFVAEFAGMGYYIFLHNSTTVEYDSLERYVGMSIYLIVYSTIMPILVLVNKRVKGKSFFIPTAVQLLFAVIETVFVIISFKNPPASPNSTQYLYTLIISVPIVAFNLLIMRAISTLSDIQRKEQELQIIEEKQKNEYAFYRLALENEQKLKVIRHDISNILQTSFALVQSGDIDKANMLLTSFGKAYPKPIRYCDNDIVNVLLSIKEHEMKEAGIKSDITVYSRLNTIPLEEAELTSVLSNILDNAISACKELNVTADKKDKNGKPSGKRQKPSEAEPEPERAAEKYIAVDIGIKQEFLVIKVENTALQTHNGERSWKSTKENTELHGFGIKILKNATKKYGGAFTISDNNGKVTAIATFSIA